jgi:hypothetical protein
MSDGQQDRLGKVEGHGVDATGCVLDVNQALSDEWTMYGDYNQLKSFSQASNAFQVTCKYTNLSWPTYTFEFAEASP